MSGYWGFSLMLNCAACDKEKIMDKDNIDAFVRELVKRIDMVAYGDPQIVNFGTGNKAGYTLVQLIETSNICAHFCNDTGDMYLDVFSCKKFHASDVISVVSEYFSPQQTLFKFIKRDAVLGMDIII